jgi:tetratricopeptide (TPR) repeat protein
VWGIQVRKDAGPGVIKMTQLEVTSARRRNAKSVVVMAVWALVLFTAVSGTAATAYRPGYSYKALRVMARLYMAYGDYSKAQPLVEQAVTLAAGGDAAESELGVCFVDLAYVYKNQGRLAYAESICKLGLHLQQNGCYQKHPYTAQALRVLSSIYRDQGNYRAARASLDRAIAIMQASHLPDDIAMACFQVDSARLLVAQRQLDRAEACYDKALKLVTSSYGADHLYTAGVLGSVARLYVLQGRYRAAQEMIQHTIAVQKGVYGADHHLMVPAWLTMADIYQAKNDYPQAERLIKTALATVQNRYGPQHPTVGKVLSLLARLYLEKSNYDQAQEVCERAVTVLEESWHNLARLYIHQGKWVKAQELCTRALSILQNAFDHEHPNVAQIAQTMAQLRYRTARQTETLTLQQPATRIHEIR